MPVRPAIAACCLLAVAAAQTPSAWASLPVPGGVVTTAVTSQGKLVAYRSSGSLAVFSAVTRSFATIPASAGASVRMHNDCLLSLDSGVWQAFSAYTGMVQSLPVSPTASYRNGAGAVNDSVLLVADGNQVHAFSAFTGTWTSRAVSASWNAQVQRHVAILADGPVLAGFDAFTGTWTDLPLAATPIAATLTADGTAAFATIGSTVHAFTAWHRRWRSRTIPAGTTFARGDDFGVWLGNPRSFGYSAIRGEFTGDGPRALGAPTVFDSYVLFDSPNGTAAWSAFTGSFREGLAQGSATLTASGAVALLVDAMGTHGYSPVLDRTASRGNLGPTRGADHVVAWGRDLNTGRPVFFSALTGRFHDAPANAAQQDPVQTTVAGGCLVPGGCAAFSARSGRFVPLLEPSVQFVTSGASAPLLVFGQSQLHAFDARTETWVSTPRSGTGNPQPQIWRTAALVLDGPTAHVFGAQSGRWSSHAVTGPIAGSRANSESARVHTANELLAASAMPSTPWLAQFPEFRRVQPANADLTFFAALPPGAFGLAAIGAVADDATPVPGFGDLWLAPGSATLLWLGAGPVPTRWTLPNNLAPAFLGRDLGLQVAALPATGFPWLTELASVRPN